MKKAIETTKTMPLTPEQTKLMHALLKAYDAVQRSDSMFRMALRITGQAKSTEEADTILKGLKMFIAGMIIPTAETACSICGNFSEIKINNEFFKDICHTCSEKMKGEFFHITPKTTSSCKR